MYFDGKLDIPVSYEMEFTCTYLYLIRLSYTLPFFPLCVDPILNSIAEFYYKDESLMHSHPRFRMFYEKFKRSGLDNLIPVLATNFRYVSN